MLTINQFSSLFILAMFMKVIFKAGSQNEIFQKVFDDLRQKCISQKRPSLSKIKDQFVMAQDLYVRSGQVQEFYDKTIKLADEIEANGNFKLSSLLINELCKLGRDFDINTNLENILFRAINNSRRNHDGFHELARITDLEMLYKYSAGKREVYRALGMKKHCCKRIIANYDENVRNFASIHKEPTPIEVVKSLLAYTYSSIGDMLTLTRPIDAIGAYNKSRAINLELGKYRAADYAKLCIRDIKKKLDIDI